MSNIYNHNRTPFTFKIDRSECWDFFLSIDEMCWNGYFGDGELVDRCLVSYIDTDDEGCVGDNSIFSKNGYSMEESVNNGLTLNNIGYTGVDNGFISFDKTRITNREFIEKFTNSVYEIEEGDKRLILNKVDGNNQIFHYGNDMVVEDDTTVSALSGGFYQGFFKSGCDYMILPPNIGDGISLEFTLKKNDLLKDDDEYTLNDRYPENKGIFFYIGTRAENKWWEKYDVGKSFDNLFNEYYSDDYFSDDYLSISAATNYFLENEPFKVLYGSDDYFGDEYLTEDCGPGNCKCECGKEETTGTYGIMYKYPELLNTYQRNSKWMLEGGGFWVENEKWTTDYKGNQKSNCKKCACDAGYFKDGYMSEVMDSCECENFDYAPTEYIEPDVDINPNEELYTKDGNDLYQPNIIQIETDNKFIIFDRTPDGYNVDNWVDGDIMVLTDVKPSTKENYFLLFDRTCHGMTADSASFNNKSYNVMNDLYRNAFGLQIKDDGSIGYKYLVQDCDSEDGDYKIESEFSDAGIIPENEWVTIHVKIVPVGKIYKITDLTTSSTQKMVMYVYVNGKLVLVTKELPTFNFRELNDTPDKQESVPFNISVGGGSQGLADVIYYDYKQLPKHALPIEKEFGGSFIGYFKSFKIYDCTLGFSEIVQNYLYETNIMTENKLFIIN